MSTRYYSEFGCTPAQYHGGLDKLWKALGLTEVQDEDVFTLAARAISERPDLSTLPDHARLQVEAILKQYGGGE